MSVFKYLLLASSIFFAACSGEEEVSCDYQLKSGDPLFSEKIKNPENVFTLSGHEERSKKDIIELLEFDLDKGEIRSIRKFCWNFLGQATYDPDREVMMISSIYKDGITLTDGSSRGITYKFGYNIETFHLWKNYVLAQNLAMTTTDTIAFKDDYPHGSYWGFASMHYFNLDTKDHSDGIWSAEEAGHVEGDFLYLSGSSSKIFDFKRMNLSEKHSERYWETLQHVDTGVGQAAAEDILHGEHYRVPGYADKNETEFYQKQNNRLFTTKDANGSYREIKRFEERVREVYASDDSLYISFYNSDKVLRYMPDTEEFIEYKLPQKITTCIAMNHTKNGDIILYYSDGAMNNEVRPQTLYATDANFSKFTKPYVIKDHVQNLSTHYRPTVRNKGCL